MAAGLGRAFAEVGVPADSLQARFVDGFLYTRLRPLLRPDAASTKLPPAVVLRLVTRIHPEFRRREKAAAAACGPALARGGVAVGVRHQARTRGAEPPLPGGGHRRARRRPTWPGTWPSCSSTAASTPRCTSGCTATTSARSPATCTPASAGASPPPRRSPRWPGPRPRRRRRCGSSSDSGRWSNTAGVVPTSLDDLRAVSPEAAALLDEYLAQRGQLIVTRYDIDGLTLGELPGTVLLSVLGATPPEEDGHEAAIVTLRARVPEDERAVSTRCSATPSPSWTSATTTGRSPSSGRPGCCDARC